MVDVSLQAGVDVPPWRPGPTGGKGPGPAGRVALVSLCAEPRLPFPSRGQGSVGPSVSHCCVSLGWLPRGAAYSSDVRRAPARPVCTVCAHWAYPLAVRITLRGKPPGGLEPPGRSCPRRNGHPALPAGWRRNAGPPLSDALCSGGTCTVKSFRGRAIGLAQMPAGIQVSLSFLTAAALAM